MEVEAHGSVSFQTSGNCTASVKPGSIRSMTSGLAAASNPSKDVLDVLLDGDAGIARERFE